MNSFDPMNPYGYREEIPGWEKMSDEEREEVTRLHLICGCGGYVVAIAIAALLCWLTWGCTATRYVPVTEVREYAHHTTDSVIRTDSVVERETTVVREVDSATMARYGVQLSAMQRAWLVETDRLRRELSALREGKTDTVVVRDSVPVPVEVVKEVPAELTWWQQTRLHLANILLWTLGLSVGLMLVRRRFF